MNRIVEEETLQQARTGDLAAIASICEKLHPKIVSYMYFRVSPNHAEDLASEVFLRVIRSFPKQKGSFSSWIYTIARNIVTDHYRKTARHNEGEYNDEIESPVPHMYGSVKILDASIDLEEILNNLDHQQRELLVLRFIQGLSCDETAVIMKMKSGAVRTMQSRLLADLRQKYNRS